MTAPEVCRDCGRTREDHQVRHMFVPQEFGRAEAKPEPTAPAFDFAPLSEDLVRLFTKQPHLPTMDEIVSLARELRASRAAMREWVDASDKGDLSRILPAEAKLRALVAHVGGGGE